MTERKQVQRLRELWPLRDGNDPVAGTVVDLVDVILEVDDRLRTIENWISNQDESWRIGNRPEHRPDKTTWK